MISSFSFVHVLEIIFNTAFMCLQLTMRCVAFFLFLLWLVSVMASETMKKQSHDTGDDNIEQLHDDRPTHLRHRTAHSQENSEFSRNVMNRHKSKLGHEFTVHQAPAHDDSRFAKDAAASETLDPSCKSEIDDLSPLEFYRYAAKHITRL